MTKPIVNLNELQFETVGNEKRFVAKRAPVSSRIGAEKLGYAVFEIPPGKSAYPYHAHREIEEMFLILEGAGTLRQAGEEYPVSMGDFICSPSDPNQPHQLINSSCDPLRYLALSNQVGADVMHYPDSGKFGVWQGDSSDPHGPGGFVAFVKDTAVVDYWDGEDDDE
jgi:uncharacterized cupin superfamily protein